MAKHCLFYAIEYHDNDIYPDFNTWMVHRRHWRVS
jgi:hypothetical protein